MTIPLPQQPFYRASLGIRPTFPDKMTSRNYKEHAAILIHVDLARHLSNEQKPESIEQGKNKSGWRNENNIFVIEKKNA
jgi:hypothetical protein